MSWNILPAPSTISNYEKHSYLLYGLYNTDIGLDVPSGHRLLPSGQETDKTDSQV